ncbi:hypothetical protein E4U31_004898 [Claviceps sp. LM219 group G6]|nr:hypothetical protein E4U31_004898 [Claviceps sp. LM219 group G6]
MATGREGRENRLNQRLRGAQRVNVGDDISFSFDLAGVPPARSSSSPAVTAQTPAGRSQSAVADVSSAGNSDLTPRGPSPNASASNGGRSGPSQAESRFVRPLSSSIARSSAGSIQSEAREENEPDELEAVAPSSSVPASARNRVPTTITEEVTESPAQKPGSGRRRRILPDDRSQPLPPSITISSSSARESPPSSPSTRRPRPGDRPARPAAPSRPPTLPLRQGVPTQPRTTAPLPRSASPKRRPPSLDTVTEEESEPSDEEAVQVTAREAATVIGQKRPRPSTTTSTELGSDNDNDNNDNSDNSELNSTSQPSSYRQKRKSPATQRQPAKRSRQHSQQSQSKRKKRHSSSSEQNDDAAVEITVQRFVNNFQRDEDDELQQEIPYANRAGETVVDVFAQVCEEVISSVLDQLQRLAAETDDGDKKKESCEQ